MLPPSLLDADFSKEILVNDLKKGFELILKALPIALSAHDLSSENSLLEQNRQLKEALELL